MLIPYHRYINDEEILSKITFIPKNQRIFKYVCRHVNDDDALTLIERFLEIAQVLTDLEPENNEKWQKQVEWLSSVVAELWKNRGVYAGILKVLDYCQFYKAISFFKFHVEKDQQAELHNC
ncbi:MAG: hypothetical protein ACFFCS_21845 [Candidatus Hodarchaeota archaeon]